MRIFITGGTGFIGRPLCRALLDAGHELTVLSRNPHTALMHGGRDISIIGSLDSWTPNSRFDAIINLAGEPIADHRWTEQRKQSLWNSRVTLTGRLMAAMAQCEYKPAVLISGSAVGFYGDRGDEALDETSGSHDGGFSERLCRAWEAEAMQAQALGVRVCILRTGLVIGTDGGFLGKMLPPFKLGLGGRIGDGKQWMPWIHRDDHIALTQWLLGSPHLSGIFNATAPNPVTNAEFTRVLAALLRRPAPFPVPAWLIRLGVGEMAELLLGGQRALPKRGLDEGFTFRFETLEPALRDALGIR